MPWNYGKARVTCSLGEANVQARIGVVVMDIVPATGATLDAGCPAVLTADSGGTAKASYSATISPANSTDSLRWSSSNEKVLSIDAETGEASFVGDGTATVKATVVDEDGNQRSDVPAVQMQVECRVPLSNLDAPEEATIAKVRQTVRKF